MPKYLATIINKKEEMWITIEYDTKEIFINAEFINGITKIKKYSFNEIEELIKDYGEQYIIVLQAFLKEDVLLKVNKQNINKIIEKSKQKNTFAIALLYHYETIFLDSKPRPGMFIEMIEFEKG